MDFLSLQAILHPKKVAISDLTSERSWTYQQLNEYVFQTVTWFSKQGLEAGDRISCIAKNRAEIVVLSLACGRAGVLFVPLNWRLSKKEIHIVLKDCAPKLLLCDNVADNLDVNYVDINELTDLVKGLSPANYSKRYYECASLILYTSGTTGTPKGVIHSEASIMETTLNMCLLAYVDDNSVFLCESPMFHVIGLISSIRPVLYVGGTILISDGFVPTRTLSRLCDRALKITHYFCVPQMANILRQQPDFAPEKLQHLKAILTGGAPHPEVQIRQWLGDGIPIVDGYGMSEAGTIFHMPFDIQIIDEKAGFVGVPGHRIETRIADTNGNETLDGVPGEVQIKGKNLFLGIWNNPELYQQCFTKDGWFKTGDVAVKDVGGFHRIVDRIKDMFISGGENVYPVEIESIGVIDEQILECALIGVPDQKWGEVGCLFVVQVDRVQTLNEEALLSTLGNSLARYKLPKYIEILDQLPRTGAGKVRKNILKDIYNKRKKLLC